MGVCIFESVFVCQQIYLEKRTVHGKSKGYKDCMPLSRITGNKSVFLSLRVKKIPQTD